ncbi:MAG: hypothetical protein J6E46_05255 [Faecalicoccus sp.]|nr:hypothetical protein [Faecalicoccus sp.]
MRWIPRKVEEEYKKIFDEVLKILPDDENQNCDFSKVFNEYLEKYGSTEAKAFNTYMNRVGDEGEICDIDGSCILDKNGHWIQDWECHKDGYLRDSEGNNIYYKDGSRVPNIIMPDVIRTLYIEELEEIGIILDDEELKSFR